jgi:glycerol-3-phosphate dehydrogenase (NAD(P)+)
MAVKGDTFMKIGVLGAGAWGTALAFVAAQNAKEVCLIARDETLVTQINTQDSSARLKGFIRPTNLTATTQYQALDRVDFMLCALPTQQLRGFLETHHLPTKPFILTSKGIEQTTGLYASEICAALASHLPLALLSGPSFADDVVKGLPTAVTLASRDEALAQFLASRLNTKTFRAYHSQDTKGVEIGGAVKNVLAIAAGIVSGRNLGASALAALISRGFNEMRLFAGAQGANPLTLTGLSGLGDLVLSCNSPQSRNFSLGVALAKGEMPSGKLAEGAFTAPILVQKAKELDVDMPIAQAVAAVLAKQITIDAAIHMLLSRPQKGE